MDTTKKNILVPIDFGEQSLLALEQSYSMSRMVNADITLLHVIIESSPFWGLFTPKEQEDVVDKFKRKLDDFAEIISKKSGINVNTIVEKGKLIEKIIEVSTRLDARFLIVGTITKDNIKEKIVGTNAIRLIRESRCPLITLKGNRTTQNCTNIVLPLDLTKETKQKVGHAVSIARYFKSTIHAVSVATSKEARHVARLENQLDQIKKIIIKQGIECKTNLIKPSSSGKSIGSKLITYSNEINADLIIIMTQQEDALTEHFIGTTAKEIVHTSDFPVMSIIPK